MPQNIYRLVDQESRHVLLTAEHVRGFFVSPESEPPQTVVFVGAQQITPARRRIEYTELEIMNHRQKRIGAYYIGRTARIRVGPELADAEYSFFGTACDYPRAGDVWQRWAMAKQLQRGEWTRYPPEHHESWLHVVQESWFSTGRRAIRYGTDDTVVIEGAIATTQVGFYCALGEAVNGPGGYFGSNLDALADCLRSSRATAPLVKVLWQDFSICRDTLGEQFTTAVLTTLREFDIEAVPR